jgi:hypothetical protein
MGGTFSTHEVRLGQEICFEYRKGLLCIVSLELTNAEEGDPCFSGVHWCVTRLLPTHTPPAGQCPLHTWMMPIYAGCHYPDDGRRRAEGAGRMATRSVHRAQRNLVPRSEYRLISICLPTPYNRITPKPRMSGSILYSPYTSLWRVP